MELQFLRSPWWCLFFIVFFATGCTLNQELKKPMGEKDFFQEISRLEKLAREDPAASVRAKSHLQLAFLFLNSRNPQLNYSRALQEMESYLSILPDKEQKDEFRNWLTILRKLDLVRKKKKGTEEKKQALQTQIEKLRISLEKVREAKKNLDDEVANLHETIEKLKNLDYQMEEERKHIK